MLNECFNKSAIYDFRKYIKNFSNIKDWTMVSDYCFYSKKDNNNSAKSDVYSYVLIPGLIQEELIHKIQNNIPKDIKKVKTILPQTIETLNDKKFFTFNFIVEKDYLNEFFKKDDILIQNHIEDIEDFLQFIETWEDEKKKNEIRTSYKYLLKKLNQKNFNLSLLKKISINSFLAAFVTVCLENEIDLEKTMWISDRDPMLSVIPRLLANMYLLRTQEIKEITKSTSKKITDIFFDIPENEKPFYDPLISIPDYICGTLARYNIIDNTIIENLDKEKFKEIFHKVLENNFNFLNIVMQNENLEIYRLMLGKK